MSNRHSRICVKLSIIMLPYINKSKHKLQARRSKGASASPLYNHGHTHLSWFLGPKLAQILCSVKVPGYGLKLGPPHYPTARTSNLQPKNIVLKGHSLHKWCKMSIFHTPFPSRSPPPYTHTCTYTTHNTHMTYTAEV
jgi:hypothetical protein